ncbi:hypothetical protein [Bacillus sp. ISL-7]|uniref:hypothetical protein n=1 Tax=Bacillus sp. ISL-7 TaxID=2819136 RepID=UPI0027E17E2F|nr:hypothetical protein [Bacillus sp. ISL-7]
MAKQGRPLKFPDIQDLTQITKSKLYKYLNTFTLLCFNGRYFFIFIEIYKRQVIIRGGFEWSFQFSFQGCNISC